MKEIGSHIFYEDVDLNLKFDFDDLMEFFKKTTKGVKDEFIDKNDTLKLDVVEKYVKDYVNQKVKDKFGEDYSLDVMNDIMNISWDIKVKSIKEKHIETWWNKRQEIEKSKAEEEKLTELISSIPYGHPDDKK